MGEYDSSIATAKRLIAKKGETVTLVQTGDVVENDEKPWKSNVGSSIETACKVVFLNYLVTSLRSGIRFEKNMQLQKGDKRALMSIEGLGDGQILRAGDVLRRTNGDKWTIKAVFPLDPNGELIMYALWIVQ